MNTSQSLGKGFLQKMVCDLDLRECTGFQRAGSEGRKFQGKALQVVEKLEEL